MAAPFLALSVNAALARASRPISVRIQTEAQRTPSPMLLLVSLKKQRLRAFDIGGEVASSRISSGQPGFDTPTGVFSILEKNEYHESNIYEGAPMPHMQRLTWSGIALHAGVVPGYRASHGCIRLPAAFAKTLFGMTKIASRVVVTNDEIDPIGFEHPKLFKPLPAETPNVAKQYPASDGTRVAVNDQGPTAASVGLAEMPLLLGVSPALAEAARDPAAFSPERPRSRAEADRATNDKLMRLQSNLRAAEAAARDASEKAKLAVREAEDTNAKLQAANSLNSPLRAAIDANEKRMQQAVRAFADFMGGNPAASRKPAGSPNDLAAEQEAELEDAILDATIDADAARAALAKNEFEFAGVQSAAAAAEATKASSIEQVRQTQAKLRFAQNDLIDANKATTRNAKQISVFISLKTERIYIRQGFEPLLEAPISVNTSTSRVGTHVMTAMRYATNPDHFEWQLVSAHLPSGGDDDDDARGKRKRDPSAPHSPEASVRWARTALDAITIPPDILTTIAELARPGASLIISDRELPANENGLGTEFVVLTR